MSYKPKKKAIDKDFSRLSHQLSSVLRHRAPEQGLHIEPDGYVVIADLINLQQFTKYSYQDIVDVVQHNWDHSKGRYSISQDGTKVRANQGHTIKTVDPDLLLTPINDASKCVPLINGRYECVHGTYNQNANSIKSITKELLENEGNEYTGLSKMARNHIHFAKGRIGDDNVKSGMRKSANLLVWCDMTAALAGGIKFYESANGVILSPGNKHGIVPSKFLRLEHI